MKACGKNIIIGLGPAGIGCAHTLAMAKQPFAAIEKENQPGGLCRTINFSRYLFDIGGHRFITRSDEIRKLWFDVLGDDMLRVNRLSRIYYRRKYFKYPLSFFDTFRKLGPVESFLCIASYFICKYKKPGNDNTFEGWIINRFGTRLYNIFFKTYTEKVWAVACQNISADWAAQRIKGLSLKVALKNAVFGAANNTPKTLSEEFLYPRTGPGEFYSRFSKLALEGGGGNVLFGKNLVSIKHSGTRIRSVVIRDTCNAKTEELPADYLFSSMPLPALIKSLDPAPPKNIISCTEELRFRSMVVVNIILDKKDLFPDQWIYVHSPEVKIGRIQNYKNWSPAMIPNFQKTSLGLEYFCTEGDGLWNMDDIDLIDYGVSELEKIGIVSRKYLISGFVVRCPDAYPVYFVGYREKLRVVKSYIERFDNLQTMGRAGLFRYDNSDHALLTGIYSSKNFLGNEKHDIWNINTDDEYLES